MALHWNLYRVLNKNIKELEDHWIFKIFVSLDSLFYTSFSKLIASIANALILICLIIK